MIEARCFGRSEIVTPVGQILPTSELVFAFALYLCVRAGEYVPRTELIELFWPTAAEAKGRHSLRQMLYRLKEVGVTLDEDGELLSLSPARVRCDLADALHADWIIEADEADIAAACDALPGLTRRFSERYGEWIDEIRARLESQFRRAALRVLNDAKTEGRWYDVEHWALMLMRTDPLNETAVLARAEGTAMLGSKAEAIEQLDRYLSELGPKAEQIGLPAKLLRRRIKEQGERRTGEHALPLIGREDEIRRLTEALHGQKPLKPQGFFVYGPAGIGKTRVLEECASIGELGGMLHISIPLSERDIDLPNSILIRLVHRLIGMRGSIGADPRAIGMVQRTQTSVAPHANTPLPGTAAITPHDLAWAAEQLLMAILEETRILITIDNVQNACADDVALFSKVLAKQDTSRVAWYFAGRDFFAMRGPNTGFPALALLTPVRLTPLSDTNATALAQQVIVFDGRVLSDQIVASAVSVAGGNPLFITELTRTATEGTVGSQLPRTLQRTVGDRIATLSPDQLELCRLVYLLNDEASLDNITALTSSTPSALSNGLLHLEYDGILRAGHSGTVTLHDCWRTAISDEMSPLTRAMLSLSAANHIAGKPDAHNHPDTLSAAARLYAEAKDSSRAFGHYFRAGRLLYERGLCQQALAVLAHARRHAASPEDTLSVLTVKACTEHALGLFEEVVYSAQEGLGLAYHPNSLSQNNQTTLTAVLADASWKAGLEFQDTLSRLEQLVTSPSLTSLTREHSCFLGLRLSYNSHTSRAADHFLKWSAPLAGTSSPTPFAALTSLVHVAERGSTLDVISACNHFVHIDISQLPLQYSVLAQRYISQSLRWAGEYTTSVRIAELAFGDAERTGLLDEAAMIALQIAFTELDSCRPHKAREWIDKAHTNSPSPRGNERNIALRHAKSRLLIQESRWAEASGLLIPRREEIFSDRTIRRRLAETACLALAAAHCDQNVIAIHACNIVADLLQDDTPSLQTDFPMTALYRTLVKLYKAEEANAALIQYCKRRTLSFQRPVAPLFVEIARALETLQPI